LRVPSIFGPRNGIPVIFASAEDSEGNSESFFYFCSMEQNSEFFSPPQKGSEWNSESFLFRGTAGIPLEIPICSGYSVFHGIILCRKFPTIVLSPCLDQLDPFFIERGLPAELEIGKRETKGGTVQVQVKSRTKLACSPPPLPPSQQLDKGSHMVSTSPLSTPSPPGAQVKETIALDLQFSL
jgi:hypothetical protein